jgi:hypothetical protein
MPPFHKLYNTASKPIPSLHIIHFKLSAMAHYLLYRPLSVHNNQQFLIKMHHGGLRVCLAHPVMHVVIKVSAGLKYGYKNGAFGGTSLQVPSDIIQLLVSE